MAKNSQADRAKPPRRRGSPGKTEKAKLRLVDEHAGPEPVRGQCTATTARGTRCKNVATALDTTLCPTHLGAKVGRPPIDLTDELIDVICSTLELGGFPETAAVVAGVSRRQFYVWLARGDVDREDFDPIPDGPFVIFRERVEEARAKGETALVAQVRQAALEGEWRAGAWLLERTRPEKYAGPRSRRGGTSIHAEDFAAGETSSPPVDEMFDDQLGSDGRPL